MAVAHLDDMGSQSFSGQVPLHSNNKAGQLLEFYDLLLQILPFGVLINTKIS